MLEVGVLAVESPPFQNHEVRLEPVVPFVVLVDECGVDLLVAFENFCRPEAGTRFKAQPHGNVPFVHFVAIGVFQYLQEETCSTWWWPRAT